MADTGFAGAGTVAITGRNPDPRGAILASQILGSDDPDQYKAQAVALKVEDQFKGSQVQFSGQEVAGGTALPGLGQQRGTGEQTLNA